MSVRGLCDKLITHPEESYRLCCVVVCDLETSRMGAPYIYDVSHLRVSSIILSSTFFEQLSVHRQEVCTGIFTLSYRAEIIIKLYDFSRYKIFKLIQ